MILVVQTVIKRSRSKVTGVKIPKLFSVQTQKWVRKHKCANHRYFVTCLKVHFIKTRQFRKWGMSPPPPSTLPIIDAILTKNGRLVEEPETTMNLLENRQRQETISTFQAYCKTSPIRPSPGANKRSLCRQLVAIRSAVSVQA